MEGEEDNKYIIGELLSKHCPLVARQGTDQWCISFPQQLPQCVGQLKASSIVRHSRTSFQRQPVCTFIYVHICVCMYCIWLHMNKLMSSKAMHIHGGGGGQNIISSENEMDELSALHWLIHTHTHTEQTQREQMWTRPRPEGQTERDTSKEQGVLLQLLGCSFLKVSGLTGRWALLQLVPTGPRGS